MSRLLPAILMAGLLAGCADDGVRYSPSLGFDPNAEANTGTEPSTDMFPNPPAGYDYYADNWYESGNGLDHGLYSNW